LATCISECSTQDEVISYYNSDILAEKVPSIVMVVPARGRMIEKMQNEPHRSSEICRDVYVIGHFLVADATGACIVTCWNEAVRSLR
jgi:hypothetical protein